MNFSPELWEQLFDYFSPVTLYVSSFFILVHCNEMMVSGYLTSDVSFCLLSCFPIPL